MNKKMIYSALAMVVLSGCGSESAAESKYEPKQRFQEIEKYESGSYDITIIEDAETDCKYIKTKRDGYDSFAMTPLYRKDGKVDCFKE